MQNVYDLFTTYARAGGGGSDEGSSGGEIIIAIGYIPSYYFGKFIKKMFPRKLELIIGTAGASLATIGIFLVFIAAPSFTSGYLLTLIAIGIWLGWSAAFFGITEKIKKRAKLARAKLTKASQSDSAWNEQNLLQLSTNTFTTYQADFSRLLSNNLASYCTPRYAYHAYLMMRCLAELDRVNVIEDIVIESAHIVDLNDSEDNNEDYFTVAFSAGAKDTLIQKSSGAQLFTTKETFVEYWHFRRSGSTWLLDGIDQQDTQLWIHKQVGEGSAAHKTKGGDANIFQDFASLNQMYYSKDMGWLFMPSKGILVKRGRFGISNIDDHVMGLHNDILMQFYRYSDNADSNKKIYAVAQINLPRFYGGIYVRPKGSIFKRGIFDGVPNNYTKYNFEWQDFNDRYEVFATDQDKLSAFELINPGFMAYLFDADPQIVLEVADNCVYLYKESALVTREDYEKFKTILDKAFKELRL